MKIHLSVSDPPPEANNVPLGQKRKRGRPKLSKPVLLRQWLCNELYKIDRFFKFLVILHIYFGAEHFLWCWFINFGVVILVLFSFLIYFGAEFICFGVWNLVLDLFFWVLRSFILVVKKLYAKKNHLTVTRCPTLPNTK
jgi:hypothetical protein